MRVTELSLTNFRNYSRLETQLSKGATLFHGDNAQGKTNLLEAIYYLATTRSPHAGQERQLINWDALSQPDPLVVGRLTATVVAKNETKYLEVRLIEERKGNGQTSFRREALSNRRKIRLMDMLGQLQVVLFLPEDVNLLTGSPSMRRRFMNITLCQTDPGYCRNLSQYNKVLEQRNATLRQLAESPGSTDVLDIFSDKLAMLAGQIFARRAAYFAEIGREAHRVHYEELTGGRESLRLGYLPRLYEVNGEDAKNTPAAEWLAENAEDPVHIATHFAEQLAKAYPADLARGATTVGPHRDDWRFWINGRNLGDYGSRGQQRSAILALKLAEIKRMARTTGEMPILLLDEVVAELDGRRRELLLSTVGSVEQALLTATDPAMFSPEFLAQATKLHVVSGRVTAETSPIKDLEATRT